MIQPNLLAEMYTETYNRIACHAEGLTHEDSPIQPPGGLNCLNWLVGHVMASRSNVLAMLGAPSVWGWAEAKRYVPGSDPIVGPNGALEFGKILFDLARSQEQLISALRRISAEDMVAPSDAGNSPVLKTLGANVAFTHVHGAQHAGQIEILRGLVLPSRARRGDVGTGSTKVEPSALTGTAPRTKASSRTG